MDFAPESDLGDRALFHFSKFQWTLVLVVIVGLRLAVGFHFFKEGTTKLKDGFESKYFLGAAKGPLAPWYHAMVVDGDGAKTLNVVLEKQPDDTMAFAVNPEISFLVWDDFADRATLYYGFGSEELQQDIAERREARAEKIRKAREEQDHQIDTVALAAERKSLEQDLLAIRKQPKRLNEIVEAHKEELNWWIDQNRVALLSHFNTTGRLDGFQQDGERRKEAALFVDSLRGQVDSIRQDRKKQLASWTAEVTAIWDSLELQVNQLAVDRQVRAALPLHRPFDQPASMGNLVDKVIPWFDTIIGISLLLGLFTRLSSLAAAGFLLSVTLSQPFWVPGTDPTYFYWIEMLALLLLFVTHAGRIAGLDYFLMPSLYRSSRPAVERSATPAQLEGQPS